MFRSFAVLLVTLALASGAWADTATIDFEGFTGLVGNDLTFDDSFTTATGFQVTFSWTSPLEILDLMPFGVTSFGMGSLSTFLDPFNGDFITLTFTPPAGKVVEAIQFDVGDFGGDLDGVQWTTFSSRAPTEVFDPAHPERSTDEILGTPPRLINSPTFEGFEGFGFQTFFTSRAYGIDAIVIKAGSTQDPALGPSFPQSAIWDNFVFTLNNVGFVGEDNPTSGLGGGGNQSNPLGGPGGPPVPEPGTLALLAGGLAVATLRRRRGR